MTTIFYLPLFIFLVRYRRTAIGPLWLLVGPSLFIALLGLLYAEISTTPAAVFVPHLAIGLVVWTLLSSFVTGSVTVFQRGRAQILQGTQSLDDIVSVEVITTLLTYLHQLPIILVVFLIYQVPLHWAAIESLFGLVLLVANGVWFIRVFGIFGARYRDLSEVFQAVMRIAFLATPIIWIPGEGGRGGVMGAFLTYNPFYHFLEIVRAPVLGQAVELLSWGIALCFTICGFALASFMSRRYAHLVPLWL